MPSDFYPETRALLLTLPAPDLLAGIRELLRSDVPAARGKAAALAGELADPPMIDNLRPLVADPVYFPRLMALHALTAIAHPDCRPLLVVGLRDEHVNCAEVALRGYVKLGAYSAAESEAL